MIKNTRKLFLLSFIMLTLAPACSSNDPYIFDPYEFNRDSLQFSKISKDIRSVKICYKNMATRRKIITKLAQKKCGEFGKIALFETQDFLHCPILTPTGMTFLCVKP